MDLRDWRKEDSTTDWKFITSEHSSEILITSLASARTLRPCTVSSQHYEGTQSTWSCFRYEPLNLITHQRLHLDSLSTKFPRCNICQMIYEDPVTGADFEKQTLTTTTGKHLKYVSPIIATGCTASRFPEKLVGTCLGFTISLSCLLLSPRTYARRAEEHMIRLFRYKSKFLRIASGEVLQQRKATYFPDQDEKKVEAARRQPLLKETISAAKESDAVPLGAIGGDDSLASDEKEMQKSEGTPDPPSTKATQAFQSKKLQNMHLLESLDEVSTWVDVRVE
ncbi:unnamed protein product [Microthlaspi erraticum]|uniref:Uncharacterized protein n=1 Tax=Microthlaspi erraticum TaxID=1685480 RepID=A0A6D2L4K6_9BRAS|nr:unnamed protein product [Microthlaspi erraticum]